MAVAEKESCSTQHTSPYTRTTVASATTILMSYPRDRLLQAVAAAQSKLRLQRLAIRIEADTSEHLGDTGEDSGFPPTLCRLQRHLAGQT